MFSVDFHEFLKGSGITLFYCFFAQSKGPVLPSYKPSACTQEQSFPLVNLTIHPRDDVGEGG